MVTYCIETAVLEATRPIGAKAVAVANKANKAASLNIIIIFGKSILIVPLIMGQFSQILKCKNTGSLKRQKGDPPRNAGTHTERLRTLETYFITQVRCI